MTLIDFFIPERGLSTEETERARLIVRLALIGVPICAALVLYHRFVLEVPAWTSALEWAVLLAAITVPITLKRTGSAVAAGAALAVLCFVGIAVVSILNGGFVFHVLFWLLLLPIAVPAGWKRFFRLAVLGAAALVVALFALDSLGALPEPIVRHSELGLLIVSAISLLIVFLLILLIGRTSTGNTYAHVAEREHYQRALMQSQKLSSVGQLTEALVHDFNNVLMSMDYARYLLEQAIDASDPRHEEIEQLGSAMERAKGLSQRLEEFGDDDSAVTSVLNVDDAVAELETVARRLTALEVRVRFELGAPDSRVSMEKSQLDQILVNLLVNANDAIEGKGEVRVSTLRDGDEVVIAVADTGSGVPEEIRDRLFDPFFTTKAVGAGTGLGLWSSLSVAQAAGGDLTVESEVGQGTTFELRLPTAESAAASSSQIVSVTLANHPRAATELGQDLASPPSRLFGWLVERVSDPRARLWGAAIAAVSTAGAFTWCAFAVWYWLGLGSPVVALALVAVGLISGLCILVMRATRSVSLSLTLLALVNFVGISALAYVRGGMPVPILLFLLLIPLVAGMQKEYPHLVPGSAILCAGSVGFFFYRGVIGAPAMVSVSSSIELFEQLIVLLTALGVFGLAVRMGHLVDARLISERDQFRRALVRSQRLETLGVFASSIAHDLNNVLMSLEFSTALLDEAIPEDHPGRIEIEQLRSACTRVRSLSKRLVRFGRDDDGGATDVDVDVAISELEPLVRPLLGRHIDLRYELDASGARVLIPVKRLEQIVLNLLLNARDSMADGGALTLRTAASSDEVIVEVADSGAGIPEEIRERVFDPFFTTNRTDEKSGLGLWLCRGIAEDAGGSITMKSSSDSGTTIDVVFPRLAQRRRGLSGQFSDLVVGRRTASPEGL